jgi:hypothetical protein
MGQISDQANTFWQLLHAAVGSSHWSVVTPQGVADNGGIVAGVANGTAPTVVGFLPSELLHFSPLSASNDGGRTWKPAYLPGALSARPDALASGPNGSLAIVGSTVLHQATNASSWSRLVTLRALRRVAPSCGAKALDAVSLAPTGTALVGTACRRGHVGLFNSSDGGSHSESVTLSGLWRNASTTVLRLQNSGAETIGLVEATRGGRIALFTVAQGANSNWTISPPLSLHRGSMVHATAIDAFGGSAVLVQSKRTSPIAEVEQGGRWITLPPLPRGTSGLAWVTPSTISFGGIALDAFRVTGETQLHVLGLTPAGSKWVVTQKLRVPLAYGSSS